MLITFNFQGTPEQMKQFTYKVGNRSRAFTEYVKNVCCFNDRTAKDIELLREEIVKKEELFIRLATELQNKKAQLGVLESQAETEARENIELLQRATAWAKDEILFSKEQGYYQDLRLNAEKEGYESVELFLIEKHKRSDDE